MKEGIRNKLFEMQEKKYQKFNSNLCPGINNIIGIRTPILRNYAKELLKQFETKKLLNNIGNEYFEEIMLQGMIIGLSKEKDISQIFKYIEKVVPKVDNWAVCDIFCGGLKIINKYPNKFWEFIQKYLDSDKEFEIRFGVVIILGYYIKEEYIQEIFKICDKIESKEYYVQMAIAWTLSICLVKHYNETLKYLKSKECKLDNFTYNKSIQKAIESFRVPDERKNILRKMKK